MQIWSVCRSKSNENYTQGEGILNQFLNSLEVAILPNAVSSETFFPDRFHLKYTL